MSLAKDKNRLHNTEPGIKGPIGHIEIIGMSTFAMNTQSFAQSQSFAQYLLSRYNHMFCVEIDDECFYLYPPNQSDWTFEARRFGHGEDEQWAVVGSKDDGSRTESCWVRYDREMWICQEEMNPLNGNGNDENEEVENESSIAMDMMRCHLTLVI